MSKTIQFKLKALQMAACGLLCTALSWGFNVGAALVTYPLTLAKGWTLLGNSLTTPIDVKQTFGTQPSLTSVWTWNADKGIWSFYAPSLESTGTLSTYAAGKGYGVLTTIQPGEGYWVNNSSALPLDLGNQSGTGFLLSVANLASGWNLSSTADSLSASGLASQLGNVTTLWAWDSAQTNWLFYAPNLASSGELASYITSHNYLDFAATPITAGQGIWINRPSTASNALSLAGDSLSYHDGYSTLTTYTLAQFQSQPGISVQWPMLDTAAIKFTLANAGSFAVTAGQTLSAAVSIRDTAANSQGLIKFDIDKIDITKNGTDITLTVPSTAVAWVYGLLADGTGMALKNFSSSVAGATTTISTLPNAVSSIFIGSAINSAVNTIGAVSNMSGTYEVIVAVKGLPLSQANGTAFDSFTVDMPTSLINPASVRSTTGFGLKGYIILTP